MKDDPIVEEIRSFRAAHAAKYDNDIDRIYISIKENEKKHKDRIVNREQISSPYLPKS